MGPVLAEPLFDGYYYDGAGRWPGIAPENVVAFDNASIAVFAQTLKDTKRARKMAINWGSGYVNPEDCNMFLHSLTSNNWTNSTLQLTWVHGAWFDITLATFLVGRGENSLLAFGLHGAYMCASEPCGTHNSPQGGFQAFGWPPILDADFGEPLEQGHNTSEHPGVWTRRWSKASATVNCSDFSGTVTLNPVHTAPLPYSATGAILPSSGYVDWKFEGTNLVTSFLPGKSNDIRSGNPGMRTVAYTAATIGGGSSHVVEAISFAYRYGAGYAPAPAAANFTAALCPIASDTAPPPVLNDCHILYTSPSLGEYTLPVSLQSICSSRAPSL